MKRHIALLVCVLLLVTMLFVACDNGNDTPVVDVHQHTYGDVWTMDDTNHWHACTKKDCTLTSTPIEHIWGEGVETTPATQEADGVKTYTCSVCNHKKTEVIEFTGLSAADWAAMTAPENFINFTYTETAVVSAAQITATSIASVAFTKDAALSTIEAAGQKNSQYVPDETVVEEGAFDGGVTYDERLLTIRMNTTISITTELTHWGMDWDTICRRVSMSLV